MFHGEATETMLDRDHTLFLEIDTLYVTMCGCSFLCVCVPLGGGVFAVEWVLELDDVSVPLSEKVVLLCVVLHQLCQRGKLLPSIEVVVVP